MPWANCPPSLHRHQQICFKFGASRCFVHTPCTAYISGIILYYLPCALCQCSSTRVVVFTLIWYDSASTQFPVLIRGRAQKIDFCFPSQVMGQRNIFISHLQYVKLCLPSAEPEVVLQLCNIYWPKVGFSFLFLFFFQGLKRVLTVNRLTRKVVNCSLASHGVLCSLCAPGFGWGMVFTPMVATVMANFTHRRALALGLGFSSIGLSSFAFNPLFQLLVETYAWRGALLILGALSLNIVPCGALIRPQRRSKAPAKVEQKEEQGSGLV